MYAVTARVVEGTVTDHQPAAFPALMRSLRLAAGLTQQELADRASLSLRTVSYLESGQIARPRRQSVEGLATALALDHATRAGFLAVADGTSPASPSKPLPASPWPPVAVADGADPDAAGCGVDAVTVRARRIALDQRRLILGQIELRFSPSTGAAWARFEGYLSLDHLARTHEADVLIETVRGDGATTAFRDRYAFDYVWTDLLCVDSSTLQATATLFFDGTNVATAHTEPILLAT